MKKTAYTFIVLSVLLGNFPVLDSGVHAADDAASIREMIGIAIKQGNAKSVIEQSYRLIREIRSEGRGKRLNPSRESLTVLLDAARLSETTAFRRDAANIARTVYTLADAARNCELKRKAQELMLTIYGPNGNIYEPDLVHPSKEVGEPAVFVYTLETSSCDGKPDESIKQVSLTLNCPLHRLVFEPKLDSTKGGYCIATIKSQVFVKGALVRSHISYLRKALPAVEPTSIRLNGRFSDQVLRETCKIEILGEQTKVTDDKVELIH